MVRPLHAVDVRPASGRTGNASSTTRTAPVPPPPTSPASTVRKVKRLVTMAAIVPALLAACTTGTPAERDQLSAIEEQQRDLGGPNDPLSDASAVQLSCIDRETVVAGLDTRTVLFDASQVGLDQRIALTNIVVDCIPQLGSLPSYRTQFTATLNSGLGSRAELDDTEGGCVLQHIIDNAPDPGRSLADGSDEETFQILSDGFVSCLDEDDLATVFGEAGTGAQAYGDDPNLDSLHDACAAGDDRSCDLLFVGSAVGSEYETTAASCGGRSDGTPVCTSGLNLLANGDIDPASPALLDAEAGCTNGDMTACDLLFNFAPLGSELEQFGFTCGGKIAVGALPNCRVRFADE